MATKAIDFTKVHTKAYKVWRIIQAPGAWGQIYRNREQALRGYKSALIFPEQVLGLNQELIFKVVVAKGQGGSVQSHITPLRKFGLYVPEDKSAKYPYSKPGQLTSMDEIRRWEADNQNPGDTHRLMVNITGQEWCFDRFELFSSLKDAAKFQAAEQAKLLSQIG